MPSKYIEIHDKKSPGTDNVLKKVIVPAMPEGDRAIKGFVIRKDEHFQIDRRSLRKGTSINFSLYCQKGMAFDLLAGAETTVLGDDLMARLSEDMTCEIVIRKADIPLYSAYLDSLLRSGPEDGRQDLEDRTMVLKENSKMLMKDLLADPRSGKKLKKAGKLVGDITDTIIEEKGMLYNMLTLSKHDYYTYTHCVNVAVLSIGLGVAIGLPRDRLDSLGIGAMLHDIGKTTIPPEILNKQGKLDDYEFRRMQEHVREGENILLDRNEFPEDAFEAVLQHHEKLSGKGYPNRLRGDKVSLYGRITGIADCYDALTTQRPYKAAFSPYKALSIIANEKEHYDFALFGDFVKMLGKIKLG